ncbi:MAG: tripartite tricarboxylate transporter substrate binding protein [Dethiobacteria bacterium]|nr:tripartite tricarboxylate transporter substrate binding protein [Bacillota bacterium]
MSQRKWFVLWVALLVFSIAVFAFGCGPATETEAPPEEQGEGEEEADEPGEGEEVAIDFPTQDLTIICPWAAGGGTDAVARVLAAEAEKVFERKILVENRTGGGGAVGHAEGASATPDGHTLTLTTVEMVILPHIQDVPYTVEDHKAVIRVNFDPAAVTVRADSPWETLDDFLADAEANPGQYRASGTGAGGIWHLAMAALAQEVGVEFTWIPSDGMAPAVTDLLGGHLEFVTGSPAEVQSQVEAGELRLLAVMSDERLPNFPDVPTLQEEGIDLVIGTWRGLTVPRETPDEVVEVLHEKFKQAYDSSEFAATMNELGLGMAYLPPEEFDPFMQQSSAEFGELVEILGLAE